jgi:hypothetical protein
MGRRIGLDTRRGFLRCGALQSMKEKLDVATFCIYTIGMTFVWDEKKNRENIRKHGINQRIAH